MYCCGSEDIECGDPSKNNSHAVSTSCGRRNLGTKGCYHFCPCCDRPVCSCVDV